MKCVIYGIKDLNRNLDRNRKCTIFNIKNYISQKDNTVLLIVFFIYGIIKIIFQQHFYCIELNNTNPLEIEELK